MFQFPRRLVALGPWLAEGKYVWIASAVSMIGLLICLLPNASESLIRLTGLALQVLGIATVVWGIRETRAYFGRPSPVEQVEDWIRRCPIFGVTISAKAGTAVASGVAGTLRGYSSVPIDPTAEADARITAVERNVALIHDRITAVAQSIDADMGKLRTQLEEEADARESGTRDVHAHIEGASTGGLHISGIGAVWLFVGVVLSTAAPELAAWRQ